jgi:hypothetical protein
MLVRWDVRLCCLARPAHARVPLPLDLDPNRPDEPEQLARHRGDHLGFGFPFRQELAVATVQPLLRRGLERREAVALGDGALRAVDLTESLLKVGHPLSDRTSPPVSAMATAIVSAWTSNPTNRTFLMTGSFRM